ncbi:BTAD domain-containing putative transcriptional regulator [Catenuloplanes sp. NPDC051500]|uniref:AfsR/SARP family transcriptional regulator n=1 Tax=Catenuloplanes sp. NPDC051500 TaxID=3363959 RepID=UPI0037B1E1D9
MTVLQRAGLQAEPHPTGSPTLRLFGPVEVDVGGRSLDLGPPQRRAVLACLAVYAETPVPIGLLVERVWGDHPPDGARQALHAHIARLRRVLSGTPAGPALLNRRNQGYLLDLGRDSVDIHHFQRLFAEAKDPAAGDPQRLRLLREALRLWRGRPLAAVPGDWASRVREGIDKQIISAGVLWAQTELRSGQAEAAIDGLSRLTSLYPLSEPLTAALMRSLWAAERRAEALQHYAATRIRFREEFGAEPGPALSNLHTAILRGELDPADPPGSAVTVTTTAAPPRQLPTASTGLLGRARELGVIEEAFESAGRIGSVAMVAIDGHAGVGKSALAVHAAHRLADRFPDGQLYVDLGGGVVGGRGLDTAEVLKRFLRAYGVLAEEHPDTPAEAAALFRTVTADRRLLMVLDHARDVEQVHQLVPGTPGSGVLVTSRRVLAGLDGATHLPLGVLSRPAAVDMLAQLIGEARVAEAPEAAAALADHCENLPLAIRVAGARLAARPQWPVDALVRRMESVSSRLDELEFAGLSVRRSFAASHRELLDSDDPVDRLAAAAFARLGRWDGPALTLHDAAALLARPVWETERLLERVVDVRLLDSAEPGVYRMPHLLRSYAHEQAR